MKNLFMILSGLLISFTVQAGEAGKDSAIENAIKEIEVFKDIVKGVDPSFSRTEKLAALVIPLIKEKYPPEKWSDHFRFVYFAITESDRAQVLSMPPLRLQGSAIQSSALLNLYLEAERKLAEGKPGVDPQEQSAIVDKRLKEIEHARNSGKMELVEAIGREYAVIAVYYPKVEPLLKLMRHRVVLLSQLNQGKLSRGQFEITVDALQRQFTAEHR